LALSVRSLKGFWVLTDSQLKVVEGVFVDLLDALVQGGCKVSQCTQMTPLIFTLLGERERERGGIIL
jgi:hypothetical protein